VFTRGRYRDVILPMTVLRRLDALLEPTKQAVLDRRKFLDENKIHDQGAALCKAAGQKFYNASAFTLRSLLNEPSGIEANFRAWLDGFSDNVQTIVERFRFRNQIPTLHESNRLFALVEKFASPAVHLGPQPVLDADGHVVRPGLSNHGMGTVFEELVRRFNEDNNEEAGEHFTPRDVISLMARLVFLPVADRLQSTTYLIYDDACGTGGMLTEAEAVLHSLVAQAGKKVTVELFGQEVNPETFAICQSDMLIKDRDPARIKYGSTLSNDGFPSLTFDFMLANPPYGKSWKVDQEAIVGKDEVKDPRFLVDHAGLPAGERLRLIPRSSDGQLLFMVNMLGKMKRDTPLGSRVAIVHNASPLTTGDAGSGESNVRRWVIENDWLEAVVALPLDLFYNTSIATYIWVLTNRKPEHRRGKVQLIDATEQYRKLRRNLGKKNCELSEQHVEAVARLFLDFAPTPQSNCSTTPTSATARSPSSGRCGCPRASRPIAWPASGRTGPPACTPWPTPCTPASATPCRTTTTASARRSGPRPSGWA
jgi:type I restriction enzyme M protein